MPFIHWIKNRSASQRAVKRILKSQPPIVGLGFKIYSVDGRDKIVLVQVSTWQQQVFMFDIRSDPEMMFEGQLCRIIEARELLKVCHDCRIASHAIKMDYELNLRNVFDTQAAYCVMLMERKLPARKISLDILHKKFGEDIDETHNEKLEFSVSVPGMFWSQRPLSEERLNAAAADVLALVPGLYSNLSLLLKEESMLLVRELSEAYLRGYVKNITYDEKPSKETPRVQRQKNYNPVTMTDEQHLFLDKTFAKAAHIN